VAEKRRIAMINQIINLISSKIFTTSDTYSLESMIVTGLATFISVCLFLFWCKKKALLNFQAWALLMVIINGLLAVHYSSFDFHKSWDFSPFFVRALMFLKFLTTVITMFRLWEISEKYIPRKVLSKVSNSRMASISGKSILARRVALWQTIKNGGNDKENIVKVRKNIEKLIKR
jgi:hypothetical protein